MSADTAFRQLREANPVPDPTTLRERRQDPAAFLAMTQQRSRDMQTQEKPAGIKQLEPPKSPRRRWLIPVLAGATAVILAIVGVIVLFSGDDQPDVAPVQTTVPTTTVPDPSGPDARPATGVSAALTESYYARATGEYDAAVTGIEPGEVTAEWFRAEGFYLVYFDGLDPNAAASLCPGAHIQSATGGPDFMSFAPTGDEGCTFQGPSVRRVSEGARPLQCDGSLAYRTFIPDDTEGVLIGTLDKTVGEGIMGVTGSVDSQAGAIPEVDISMFEC